MAGIDGLNPQFTQAIEAMIAASGGRLSIESGYRSGAQQAALYQAAVQKYGAAGASKWVAPPGHSNHERGMAVDLSGDISLAHQLAPRFGLVFPMSWEPWHIEPVHARDSSSPQAYTTPPPGEQNPVGDQSLNTRPEFIGASIANAMSGALSPTDQSSLASAGTDSQSTTAAAPAAASSADGSVPAGAGGTGSVAPGDLYKMLTAQGLSPEAAAAGVSIAGRESSYQPDAYNGNAATGDNSYGLFQVNLLHGGWTSFLQANGMKDPQSELRTPEGSVKAFALIYGHSGLNPWGGYKGVPWSNGTNLQAGADASGGAVTVDQLRGLT